MAKRKRKKFDCIAMKRAAQREIIESIRGLTPEQQIARIRKDVEEGPLGDWWRTLRKDPGPGPSPVLARPSSKRRTKHRDRLRVRRMTSTEVRRDFASVIDRVRDQGQAILVERRGECVCVIIPPVRSGTFTWNDLARLIGSAGTAGEEWATAVETTLRDQPPAEVSRSHRPRA